MFCNSMSTFPYIRSLEKERDKKSVGNQYKKQGRGENFNPKCTGTEVKHGKYTPENETINKSQKS